MNNLNLGKLEQVNIRQIWAKEHEDFTPWLANNLHFIGEIIGAELELEAQEKAIGNFRADIVAKDIGNEGLVLIENQLERTDHCHLGQLLTYASGLKAATVIWIACQFADEHLATLDWLNNITDDAIRFFGLQIEAWRIDTAIAPKFNIVSRPNSWVKKGKSYRQSIAVKQRVSHTEVIAYIAANPALKRAEVAENLGISERKVYDAIAWGKERTDD